MYYCTISDFIIWLFAACCLVCWLVCRRFNCSLIRSLSFASMVPNNVLAIEPVPSTKLLRLSIHILYLLKWLIVESFVDCFDLLLTISFKLSQVRLVWSSEFNCSHISFVCWMYLFICHDLSFNAVMSSLITSFQVFMRCCIYPIFSKYTPGLC